MKNELEKQKKILTVYGVIIALLTLYSAVATYLAFGYMSGVEASFQNNIDDKIAYRQSLEPRLQKLESKN